MKKYIHNRIQGIDWYSPAPRLRYYLALAGFYVFVALLLWVAYWGVEVGDWIINVFTK